MKIKILVSIVCMLTMSSVIGLNNPVIIADENSPDINYAKILMDNLYPHKTIEVIDNNTVNVSECIFYDIPATDEFKIGCGAEELHIKFEKDENGLKFDKVEYIKKLDSSSGNINFLGKSYNIIKHTKDEIILSDEVKNITTNESFEYKNYKIVIKAMTFDGNELLIDILKDGNLLNNIKIHKGELETIANSDISIYYENLTTRKWGNIFSFKIYSSIELVDDEDFKLDNNFKVNIDDTEITLKCKNPENLKENFNLFNYNLKLISINNETAYFKVFYNNNYQIKKEDVDGTECIGNNIFVVKKNDKLYVYKDGKEVNKTTEYIGSKIILDDDVLKSDGDLVLIGGPVSNDITKKISDKLIAPITNKNPGKNAGIIQKIKNPYNPNYYIYVLAGSDRYGTKACVLALLNGLYKDEDIITVKLENNKPIILKNK